MKSNSKKQKRVVKVNKETIRNLSASDLGAAQGGRHRSGSFWDCQTNDCGSFGTGGC